MYNYSGFNRMRICWHKAKNWEYWPAYIIYMPTFFYWVWLMIKYRSFSFYKYSNPSIKNGGFYGDSKMDIYKLLPQNKYPKTLLIKENGDYDYGKLISENKLSFPLILKPDIGLRGIDVVKVDSILEIENYCQLKKTNFLIQEFIDLPNEIGLFYCRVPNENNGKITGITLKKFLTIEGNGFESVEQLLKKNYRYEMQISKLKDKISLNEVLPLKVKRCLVPFGNHNRGTEFLDGNLFISDKLNHTFNSILNSVPGFYFGRLDIRYNTFEELERGENFSLIELNGAKSEPTHIYDPKNSFWSGQKEIFRHQKIMQRIVKVNVEQLKTKSSWWLQVKP
ncbi:MAG: D-alanine--D-alanine ligase [Cytophagales bacterium]|nr:MAG: D-alanine--D-alanine ligase [Cytophagales bacterium]